MGKNAEERVDDSNQENLRLGCGQIIPAIVWATGVFVALLWISGRAYSSGFFGAMNIPIEQLSFSMEEYAASGWFNIVFYASIAGILAGIGWIVILFNLTAIWLGLKKVSAKTFKRDSLARISNGLRKLYELFRRISQRTPMLSYWDGILLISLFALSVAFSLMFAFYYVGTNGETAGRNKVLHHSTPIELISNVPLNLETNTIVAGTTDTFIYQDYRLLTYN